VPLWAASGRGTCSVAGRSTRSLDLMKVAGFRPTASIVTTEQVSGAEALLGFSFPSAYRELVARYNGSSGSAKFPIPGAEHPASIGHWLSLLPWDSESIWATVACWKEHDLPRQLVPIADTAGGDYLCLDYRSGKLPRVVMWYHELPTVEGIHPVAESFDAFMATLTAHEI
jgi:SMI1/KNR4 family protein SUKH-1